jgi:hypothetical protein
MLASGLSSEIFTLRNPALARDLGHFKSMRVALVVIVARILRSRI